MDKEQVREAVEVLAPLAFMSLVAWWGFKHEVKQEALERQDYKCANCGDEVDLQAHHIVPEKMLVGRGIKGKSTVDNCVMLCTEKDRDCHEVFDRKAAKGIFYPNLTIDEVPPETYVVFQHKPRKNKQSRRRNRR